MVDLYDYLDERKDLMEDVKAIYRVSGIMQLEEMLSNIRDNPKVCLLVEENADGTLNLKDRKLRSGYHVFYVFVKASSIVNSAERVSCKKTAFAQGLQVINLLRNDAGDYGDPAYGLDDSRIDYGGIGPIGNGYFGYSFGFMIHDAFTN